jgi:transposase
MPWTTREELLHQTVALHRQGLSRRAIARALTVSRNTVRKLLTQHGRAREAEHTALQKPMRAPRVSKIDPFRIQVKDLLERYPEITSQRVFEELRQAGFDGGYTAVKKCIRTVRPRPAPTPSLPTEVHGPAKMAESDWSPFTIDFTVSGRDIVQIFSYVLTYSTRKSFSAFARCDHHALMDGHLAAFARFEGAAHACKYDCQKAVVLGWEGRQPIYNPRFLAFATHYEFQPVACRPGHPNDKPRTERSFWEFEQSFLNGRSFRDLDDLRQQLATWERTTCDARPHKKTHRSKLEMFAEERPLLRPLPLHPYDTARVLYRVCSVDGFVAVDANRYAVPYDHITEILPVRVTQHELFVYAADLRLVARHELAPRGRGVDVDPDLIHPPWNRRGADLAQVEQAFAGIGVDGARFFAGLTAAQGRFAGYHARQILLLRERYATADLGAALAHARSFGAFEHQAIARILAARAAPRRLAEYVAEETARRFDEPVDAADTCLRDLDEYDRLPVVPIVVPTVEEAPCPDASNPQAPATSPSGSTSTSKSSA